MRRPRCCTPKCRRVARVKGLCRACYHREYIRAQERHREPERHVSEAPEARRLRLVKDAYACAVTVEARVRLRGELEVLLREAAN
jgi:hypothetical protein